MDFLELARGRESIRSYDPGRPLDRPILEQIAEAGRVAPSAANRQPWRFVVASSAEALARVRRCYGRPWLQDAPHVLAVVGDASRAWVRASDGYNAIETDLTIAMDHMILAAESLGVGTCWIAAFDPVELRAALGLRENERVFAITPLGYPRAGFARRGTKDRRPLSDVLQVI
jgi:nitroreductase